MKAVEVIEQYKNGRRDFRGESLRGCNFKNQDLSGADFRGCDIRGANFSRANLTEVKFEKAKAGLRKRSVVILLLATLGLIVISCFFFYLNAGFIRYISDKENLEAQITGWVSLIFLLPFFVLILRKDYILALVVAVVAVVALAALESVTITGAVREITIIITRTVLAVVIGETAGAVLRILTVGKSIRVAKLILTATEILVAILLFVLLVFSLIFSLTSSPGLAFMVLLVLLLLVLGMIYEVYEEEKTIEQVIRSVGEIAIAFTVTVAVTLAVARLGEVAVAGTLTLFFCYIGWLTLKQEHRDPRLRTIAIAFAVLGGTSFFQANLTATDFTGATLKSTNFNQAILNKTIFKQAIKLELARPGTTLLVNPQVRELLINPSKGADQDLTKADLRGANLDGANLQRTDLRLADLSQASFKYANLREANLTEVNAVNADLSYATLTGACVENWNIDATTQLAEVDCQYIYLLNNQKERRPSSGEFEPGEFTQLFEEVFDTVDLIFRDGMDWKALMNTLKEVQVQNEDTPLQVQAIENKGDGVFIIKVHVPPDANKEKIHQELTEIYQIKDQLTAQDKQLKFLREQNTDLTQIIKIQAQNQAKVEISYNKHDHSQTINVGQDFTITAQDSTVNLRDINSSTQASGENHEH